MVSASFWWRKRDRTADLLNAIQALSWIAHLRTSPRHFTRNRSYAEMSRPKMNCSTLIENLIFSSYPLNTSTLSISWHTIIFFVLDVGRIIDIRPADKLIVCGAQFIHKYIAFVHLCLGFLIGLLKLDAFLLRLFDETTQQVQRKRAFSIDSLYNFAPEPLLSRSRPSDTRAGPFGQSLSAHSF